ncbi:hypothetical protein [Bradyrhizobium huanghuaihaiense]|uniref:hypothetical protein n=1 Tax=Bradyrhizobium huanghuaihaiense TaxID=990078 RepID=UPI0004776341|nr:hypothetical protein [Bradyrhizobium huanghuaihaiense]
MAKFEIIERRIVGQVLPVLSFGEQLPTSIRMMRGCLTAQRCHRAQATRSIHSLLPAIFCFFHLIFFFCGGVIMIMAQN